MAKSASPIPPGCRTRLHTVELHRTPGPSGKLMHATVQATQIEDLTPAEMEQRQAAMFSGGHA